MIKYFLSICVLLAYLFLGCKGSAEQEKAEVNVYTHRYYDIDKDLFKAFEEETGVKVNVKHDKTDKLLSLLKAEGNQTQADLLITVDAGRLQYAREMDLLQSFKSAKIDSNLPQSFRDKDGFWMALTRRHRVIAYHKGRLDTALVKNYGDLGRQELNGRLLIRSSNNIYNQSLVASLIANQGAENAYEIIKGWVANFARTPKGNDRDQVKSVALGEGDCAVINTYYIGKLAFSKNEEERKAISDIGIIFPNQETTGTHTNISGAAIVKHAPNYNNAVLLLEYLSSLKAQEAYAHKNYEFPVNPDASLPEFLSQWPKFKIDSLDLNSLGYYNQAAVELMEKESWF